MIPHFEKLLHRHRQLKILFFNDRDELKPEAKYYFAWLKKFCYADRPCYKQNPITGSIDQTATHVAEGRREVWLAHQDRLSLDTVAITRQIQSIEEEDLWQNQPPQQPNSHNH